MTDMKIDDVKDEVDSAKDAITGDGESGGGDLGRRILIPAAAGLGTLAATLAARKAPDLVRDRLKPMIEDKLEQKGAEATKKVGQKAAKQMGETGGPMGKIVGKALEKATGGGDDDGGGKGGKTRRLPIQRYTDVAAPIATVYQKWTQFEEFPNFMHRVLSVNQEDDKKVSWEEKIWFSKRQWEGEITDRRKNDRIAWKTTKGTSHTGVVSFHRLDDHLTRVMVTMDFHPSGMLEKMASGLRFVKRAVEADLARFKAYVELGSARGLEYTHEATTQDEGDDDKADEQEAKSSKGDEQETKSRTSSRRRNGRDQRAEKAESTSQANGSSDDGEGDEQKK